MRIEIQHKIFYNYSEPVFLEPHTVRMTPRSDPFQTLESHDLFIEPEPAGISRKLSLEANIAHHIWFNDKTDYLTVTSVSTIDTHNINPFDFIVYPHKCSTLPMDYPLEIELLVKTYTEPLPVSTEISDCVHGLCDKNGYQLIPSITAIIEYINENFVYEPREHGEPYSPDHTFSAKKGSCRDFAVLCMAMFRHLGIATRFVSGYFFDESLETPPELHAWVEVYIPGGGWRGFDPTNAIAVHGNHIVLAACADPDLAQTVTGSFRGSATSKMTAELSVSKSV